MQIKSRMKSKRLAQYPTSECMGSIPDFGSLFIVKILILIYQVSFLWLTEILIPPFGTAL